METVYKYEVKPDNSAIKIPVGAEILHVGFQGSSFCLWAKIDTKANVELRSFHTFPTGGEIPQNMGLEWGFIGTGFINDLVFHCFERLGL